jgi:hypothetical protein
MQNHLIQILLPLSDNEGQAFSGVEYEGVRSELTKQFGGLTAFTRGPLRDFGRRRAGQRMTTLLCSR